MTGQGEEGVMASRVIERVREEEEGERVCCLGRMLVVSSGSGAYVCVQLLVQSVLVHIPNLLVLSLGSMWFV